MLTSERSWSPYFLPYRGLVEIYRIDDHDHTQDHEIEAVVEPHQLRRHATGTQL